MKGFDLDTKVVIACDVSGSMQQPVSAKSKILMYDIGLLLGMLLQSKCDNVIVWYVWRHMENCAFTFYRNTGKG